MSISFGCSRSQRASQSARVLGSGSVAAAGNGIGALPLQHRDRPRDAPAQLAPVDDRVDRAGLQQELGALEALGQLLAHGVLDHPRPGKADQRLRLGDHHVAQEREARGHTAHRRIGQHADVGQARFREVRECRVRLRHLHQAQQAFLHARATGGGEADEGCLLFDRGIDAAHEALADDRAHRAAHELELEAGGDDRHAVHGAAHHDERIGLAGGLQRVLQPLGVLLAVLELQRIDRQHLLADLVAAFGVEEGVEPRARADAVMMAAFRTDVDVLLEIGLVEHGLARRALDPQPLGHRAAILALVRLDLRGQQFFEPAHGSSPITAQNDRPGKRVRPCPGQRGAAARRTAESFM